MRAWGFRWHEVLRLPDNVVEFLAVEARRRKALDRLEEISMRSTNSDPRALRAQYLQEYSGPGHEAEQAARRAYWG